MTHETKLNLALVFGMIFFVVGMACDIIQLALWYTGTSYAGWDLVVFIYVTVLTGGWLLIWHKRNS